MYEKEREKEKKASKLVKCTKFNAFFDVSFGTGFCTLQMLIQFWTFSAEMHQIPLHAFRDDLLGGLSAMHLGNRRGASFELLVHFKEVGDLASDMGRKLAIFLIKVPGWIVFYDCDDLIITAAAIDHADHTDRIALDHDGGIERFGAQYEHIEGISIVCIGTGDKPIVCRIMCRGIKDPVQSEQTGAFVQLILFFTAGRDLDDRSEAVRCDERRIDIMPDVQSNYPFSLYQDSFGKWEIKYNRILIYFAEWCKPIPSILCASELDEIGITAELFQKQHLRLFGMCAVKEEGGGEMIHTRLFLIKMNV